jgi:Transcriptional regulator
LEDNSDRSLRERKKAKTRALIQTEALRLFREQGYEETTIEQIAEAAEVSSSTIFRYFPTKQDLVIYDALDESFIEQFRAQPPELNAIQVLRNVLREYFGLIPDKDIGLQFERARLMKEVPELRGAMFDEFGRTLIEIRDLIAERSHQASDDDAVLALSGAVFGIVLAAWLGTSGDDWLERCKERIDKGISLLESGFGK